ncbi:MAG: succinoglycan biosynthesis ketolase [Phormidesmis priestleyi]|uniref:Succinoglycan biosynthesis ketolase n=1 Tax=Phormidesmis priestleyi TaxID=268141 RepID=A0A2W4XG63_9CYAN|nr:MAG: succinoglycan biosynthesis ketolase [Phormidesmis priestleyi]
MKLFYYQRPDQEPNFGDELNGWLWTKLWTNLFNEDLFNEDDSIAFVGMGTLLNNKLAERIAPAQKVVVFSTGVGYEQPIKKIPPAWHISCLRGPLSAKRLGLPSDLAITDGGLLVAKLFKPSPKTFHQEISVSSFMPHIHSATAAAASWQRICQQANIRYIDPRWPIEEVLQAIGSSELLLAEAMHGAIAADALRVPWIPVVTSPRIYAFKWQDWCASMNLPYSPYRLPSLAAYPRWGRGIRSGSVAARHWLKAGFEGTIATIEYGLSGNEAAVVRLLMNIAVQAPFLSRNDVFEQRLEALQACFSQLPKIRSFT